MSPSANDLGEITPRLPMEGDVLVEEGANQTRYYTIAGVESEYVGNTERLVPPLKLNEITVKGIGKTTFVVSPDDNLWTDIILKEHMFIQRASKER